jgi:hypothetical protein
MLFAANVRQDGTGRPGTTEILARKRTIRTGDPDRQNVTKNPPGMGPAVGRSPPWETSASRQLLVQHA